MKLVFLGPPGAGKGTQAGDVAASYGIKHISTGDMLRAAIANGTPTGLKAKVFTDAGQLVPDAVVIDMVDERLHEPDCASGYLLDGFPRTVEQAEALQRIAAPDLVIEIAVADEHLLSRLSGRRVCGACKGTFHITRLADERVCPTCGAELIHRADDQADIIAQRLTTYHQQTSPLIDYYRTQGTLRSVDGAQASEAVRDQIQSMLESKA